MPYPLYGKRFREIRTQKQLPLSYFETVGVDKSDLSKFERGKRMIGFERVDAMLQHMGVSLAEYELYLNDFGLDIQEDFLRSVYQADIHQDHAQLHVLYEEARSSGYSLLSFAAKACFTELNQEEIIYILNSLNRVTIWGYLELSVLYFSLDHLSTEEMKSLFRDLEKKSQNYSELFKYNRRILQIAYRAVAVLCKRGEKDYVGQILKQIEKRSKVGTDIYVENLRRLALGVNHYYFVNQKEGIEQINKCLDIFSFLEHDELAQYYRNRVEHILKEKSI